MTASTPVPTAPEQQTPPDLDALEGQVNDHLAELNEERGRLSLDAIGGDEAALAELTDCETQIAEAVEALARIDAARVELTRRAIAEENDRRSKEHREAIVQAKALQSERYDAAVALDKAAQVFAAAAASYRQAAIQQVSRLAAAGIREDIRSGASPRAYRVEWALLHAMRQHGAGDMLSLPPITNQWCQPLAASDPDVVSGLQ